MMTIPGLILHLPFPSGDPNYNHVAYDSTFNFYLGQLPNQQLPQLDRVNYKYEGASGKFVNSSASGLIQPASTLLHFGTGDFTIGFWICPTTPISSQNTPCFIGQQRYSNASGFMVYKDDTAPTKLSFRINTNLVSSNGDITTGVWEHWAIVRASGTLYIFKNGQIDKTVANFTTPIVAGATYLTLGYNQPWETYYNGNLDDVFVSNQAVWTEPFTPDEVYWDGIIHMPETRPIKSSYPLHSYPGDEIPVFGIRQSVPVMFINGDRFNVTVVEKPNPGPVRFEPWDYGGLDDIKHPLLFTNTNGNLRGVVKQNTIPIALCQVALYDRYTKGLINATVTKSDGTFRFDNLILGYGNYFLVAFDPQGLPLQNAIVLDKLVAT